MPLDGHIFLQPLDARHLASIHRLHQDPITQQYAWIDGLETEEANARWMVSELSKGILGFKALILKENNKFVGLAGLRMRTDLGGKIDIAYRILPEQRNQGYATQAAGLLIHIAKNELKLESIYGQVHVENTVSLSILKKVGFIYESTEGVWQLHELRL